MLRRRLMLGLLRLLACDRHGVARRMCRTHTQSVRRRRRLRFARHQARSQSRRSPLDQTRQPPSRRSSHDRPSCFSDLHHHPLSTNNVHCRLPSSPGLRSTRRAASRQLRRSRRQAVRRKLCNHPCRRASPLTEMRLGTKACQLLRLDDRLVGR